MSRTVVTSLLLAVWAPSAWAQSTVSSAAKDRELALKKRIEALRAAADYEAALPLAREVLDIRMRTLPADHSRVRAARVVVRGLEIIAALSPDARAELAEVDPLDMGVVELPLAEREAALQKQLAVRRRHLPPDHFDIASTLHGLGRERINNAQYAAAEEPTRQAATLRRALLGDHVLTSNSMFNVGLCLAYEYRFVEARPFAAEAVRIRLAVGMENDAFTAYFMQTLGWILIELNRWNEARTHTAEALRIRRALFGEDDMEATWSMNNLAVIEAQFGDYATAERYHREVLAIRQRQPEPDLSAIAHVQENIGLMLSNQGQYCEAISFFEQALANARTVYGEDDPLTAGHMLAFGDALRGQGRYDEAEQLLVDALAILRKSYDEDHPEVARGMINLALQRINQGAVEEARTLARKALAINRARFDEDHESIAHDMHILGWALRDSGRYDEAEILFREALDMYESLFGPQHPRIAQALCLFGPLLQAIGDDVGAEAALRRGLAVRRASHGNGHWCVAEDTQRLAGFLREHGQCEEARTLLIETLAAQRKHLQGNAHPDLAHTLLDLAHAAHCVGDLDAAIEHANDAMALYDAVFGPQHPTSAMAAVHTAGFLGDAGRHEDANALYMRGTTALRTANDPALPEACTRFADYLATTGAERQRIIALYEEAIEAIETQRQRVAGDELDRARFFSRLAGLDPHGQLARVILDDGNGTASAAIDALAAVEQKKARALLDLLNRDAGAIDDVLEERQRSDPALASQIEVLDRRRRQARSRVARSRHRMQSVLRDTSLDEAARAAEMRDLTSDRQLAERDLRRATRELFELARAGLGHRGLTPAAPDDIMKQLGPDEAMVVYDIGTARSLAWVIRSNGLTALELTWPGGRKVTEESLEPRVGTIVRHLQDRSATQVVDTALGRALLPSGIRSHLQEARVVCIVADGLLHDVPFEVLLADTQSAPAVVYAPSATLFINRRQRAAEPREMGERPMLVAVGDPTFMHDAPDAGAPGFGGRVRSTFGRLDPLPGTRTEVETIAALVRQRQGAVHCLVGDQATLAATARASSRPRYLHFATHGLVGHNPGGFDSALVLAIGPQDDGLLRLEDLLYDWSGKLEGTEMVVLSACRTARGQFEKHDGFVALTWGFLHAGADSVLATLWPVDDISTAILMEELYRGLIEAELTRAEALRRAKDKLRHMTRSEVDAWLERHGGPRPSIERTARAGTPRVQRPSDRPFEHPYYWAPFVLVGGN